MRETLNRLREAVLAPLLSRPRLLQVAALCVRQRGERCEVLLVTSRTTRRWILPKGWPHRGLEEHGSALAEAWEEAGVKRADVSPSPVGRYPSTKRSKSGLEEPCEILVFRVDVRQMADDFPERDARRRVWVTPAEAAEMVDEPGLKALLHDFATTSPSA